ncbi:POP3 [Candida oxycetoniae]|uniref:POP3 n=1 Tax=Candida oxycetoniae TaxID=497107 RepID=A0AAI9X035_9ASCO|nr:POP3 [Candida oxycetoniae]KAI3407012.2 POP3 [Candida oxycetoniae]
MNSIITRALVKQFTIPGVEEGRENMAPSKSTAKDAHGTSLKARNARKNQNFRMLLDNPFTQSNIWPFVEPQVSTDILDLFEALVGPLFKSQVDGNKRPFVKGVNYGFNSTVEVLERQAANNRGRRKDSVDQLKYILVCKYDITPQLLITMFPVLCFTASKSPDNRVKLVQLPRGSMSRLSQVIGVPKTGIVGLSSNLKEAQALFDLIERRVSNIDAPWLNQIFENPNMFYQPKVKQIVTVRGDKKQKRKQTREMDTEANEANGNGSKRKKRKQMKETEANEGNQNMG